MHRAHSLLASLLFLAPLAACNSGVHVLSDANVGGDGGGSTSPSSSPSSVLVSDVVTSVSAMAVDASYLYWTEAFGGVNRVALAGGPRETLLADAGDPVSLAIDGQTLYLVDESQARLFAMPIGGGAPVQVGEDGVVSVTANAGGVYWIAPSEGKVFFLAHGSSSPVVLVHGLTGKPDRIAASATDVVWADAASEEVQRSDANGAGVATLGGVLYDWSAGLTIAAGRAFWTANGVWMWSEPLDGSGGVAVEDDDQPAGITADDAYVYWGDFGPSIHRVSLTDGAWSSELFVPGDDGANVIKVMINDATNLYYAVETDGTIRSVAK